MKLDQKKVIVVGASSGIGASIARALGAKNCSIGLVARREELMHGIADEINTRAGRTIAQTYVGDVTHFDEAEPLLDRIAGDMGGVDVLIYVSGIMPAVQFHEYSFDKDRAMIEVNLLGAMAWINAAAKRFETARAGAIVGISSIAGDRGRGSMPGYITSKAALDAYLESIRNRISRYGVQVTTIKPGYVATDLLGGAKTPLKAISPDEAAAAIVSAIEEGAQVRYVPGFWRWIGMAVKLAPSFVMQRVKF
ncbi:MAG: SDR family NAD(P)-dependent oxidoreductase [Capsulimonadaceae bacterium]|nr:SDR family NAD(P)-dependent oxidoreductase [Capsulimonadaceae bacterium]